MKRILIAVVLTTALTSVATAWAVASHVSVNWPAACTGKRCVNRHLNNLDQRLHRQSHRIRALEGRLACFTDRQVSQYPASAATTTGGAPPGVDANEGGTWLDLTRPDNPQNNGVFKMVEDVC